jgi:hypothetical protein
MENKKFNLETLSLLPTFTERREYCDNALPVLGYDKENGRSNGSTRIVYQIDKDYVLKLAYVREGISQNELESDDYNQHLYSDIVTKIKQHDKSYKWLITEYAKPITEKIFFDKVGISFKTWSTFVLGRRVTSEDGFLITEHLPFTTKIIEMCGEHLPVDLSKIDSYGLVGDKIKLIDYGVI